MESDVYEMIDTLKVKYNFRDKNVLEALRKVSRESFIPLAFKNVAYSDQPVDIGFGQTASQPYTVAFMTYLLIQKLKNLGNVLEIGTGSGYQSAILSKLFETVYSIEIIPQLAKLARKNLRKVGISNVTVKDGTGEFGWKKKSPFDAIIITAGIEEEVPQRLKDQLKKGGVLVAPVGIGDEKQMLRIQKTNNGKFKTESFGRFKFVPFVKYVN